VTVIAAVAHGKRLDQWAEGASARGFGGLIPTRISLHGIFHRVGIIF
jgi:hypothetical protein